ncbi:Zinc finger protein 629 [Mizuhopecten yessoensis]|uniref:Zinc finger protein 629 n=2 Tax=Mizuhopecten yessoensis TaxID=6573 RepID=A0A210Q3F2_MIZYE|nr:Zinc finger protein 629 [Mizuhopecten yessoensis]
MIMDQGNVSMMMMPNRQGTLDPSSQALDWAAMMEEQIQDQKWNQNASGMSSSQSPQPVKADRCYVCAECLRSFTTKQSLKRHEIAYHTFEYEFVCKYCKKGFIKNSVLQKHLMTHIMMSEQCPKCGKELASEYEYKCHTETCQTAEEEAKPNSLPIFFPK